MSKKLFPTDVINQGKNVLDAWRQIDDQLSFGALDTAALTVDINRARGIEEAITNLENQLTNMRNQRDAANNSVWDKVKRARAGVKATYGDNSSQYEMVGGTRLSERKTPTRRTAPPA